MALGINPEQAAQIKLDAATMRIRAAFAAMRLDENDDATQAQDLLTDLKLFCIANALDYDVIERIADSHVDYETTPSDELCCEVSTDLYAR